MCNYKDTALKNGMFFFPKTSLKGVTFKVEGGDLTIARILHGGIVDQQGLLHVGDIIKEVRRSKAAISH